MRDAGQPRDRDPSPGFTLPTWALPGELAVLEGWPAGRRTVRDWAADVALFVAAALVWIVTYRDSVVDPDPDYLEVVPNWIMTVDPWVGAMACLALWLRRRYPLALAITMVPVLFMSSTGYGAVLAALLTVAIHRGWLPATLVTAAITGQSALFALAWRPPGMTFGAYLATVIILSVLPLSWGLVVRFRRQLIASLRRDAQRQLEEQERRVAETRRAERQRIAWEMHDVLAHRISLLSVHAGALAFRTADADGDQPSSEEIHRAVQVIRENAHQALDELGEVLAVLRTDDVDEQRDALPMLADLPRLAEEARAAGQHVQLTVDLPDASAASPRPQEQRTIYRVVQEGLTNARKHAPDGAVTVRVDGRPGDRLTVRVTNPTPPGTDGPSTPGAEAGLAGLRERVELDGGSLDHGELDGAFQLTAELPWRR